MLSRTSDYWTQQETVEVGTFENIAIGPIGDY